MTFLFFLVIWTFTRPLVIRKEMDGCLKHEIDILYPGHKNFCSIMGEACKGTEFNAFGFTLQLLKLLLSIYTFPRSAVGIDLLLFLLVLFFK